MHGPKEHWFLPGGEIVFCDGCAGVDVPNHDLVVRQYLTGQLLSVIVEANDDFASLATELEDLSGDTTAMRGLLYDWFDQNKPGVADDDPQEYLRKRYKWGRLQTDFAFGTEGPGAILPREYAVRKLGWIRQQTQALEIQKPTRVVLNLAARCLFEVYDKQVLDATFDIDVSGTRRFFLNVPYAVLDKGSPQALLSYAGHRSGV